MRRHSPGRPLALIALLAVLAPSITAALPLEFAQEGLVLDDAQRPVEGVHRVRIRLFADARGGAALFDEIHPAVEFFQGYYFVPVGSIEPLAPALFTRPSLHMGIIIDDGDELQPRTPLRLVPGAFFAHTAANVVGDITPSSVSIDGVGVVIDGAGRWVGDPTGLRGPAGPAGPEGPVGPQGPAGAAGGDGSPDTPQQVRDKLRQVDGAGSGVDADLLDGRQASAFVRTAADVLDRLRTVDGAGSGLDADRLDGLDSDDLILTPQELLARLRTVDGRNSGLDADRLDGLDSSQIVVNGQQILERLAPIDGQGSGLDADRIDGLDSSQLIADAATILQRLSGVDGRGSGLDADRLDGLDSSVFLQADDPTLPDRAVDWVSQADGTGSGLDADRLDGLDSTRFMRVDRDTGTAGSLTVGGPINAAAGVSVRAGARVGIGVEDPQAELHVDGTIIADEVHTRVLQVDVLRLNPLDRAPAPASAGMLYFDSGTGGLRYHDGRRWQNVAAEGPRTSCLEVLESGRSIGNGDYVIDFDGPEGPMPPQEVFCDMETDGGGWTRIDQCLALQVLGGRMVAEEVANTAAIDGNCRPYTRDSGNQEHSYHYTFAFPAGFSAFYLDDYVVRANASNTSDLDPGQFVQGSWSQANGGSKGDISFGTAGQNGPVTSYARYVDAQNCQSCQIAFPRNGRVFALGGTYDTFRMGWGERGSQSEGWYPWWSGSIMLR